MVEVSPGAVDVFPQQLLGKQEGGADKHQRPGQGVQLPLLQWHQLLVNEYGNQTWVFSLLI